MANVKIRDFANATALNDSDYFVISQSSASNGTVNLLASQLATYSKNLLSSTATGLDYSNGVFSLASGYVIPTSVSLVAITSLNGLVAPVQTFAIGTAGTSPAFVSSSSTHTLNIPIASNSNTGLINTGTQTIGGAKTFSGGISSSVVVVTGLGGTGYVTLPAQSSTVNNPVTGLNIWSDASARFGFKNTLGASALFDSSALTTDRIYTLPDAALTLVGGTGTSNQLAIWNGTNTISSAAALSLASTVLVFGQLGGTISIKTGSNAKAGSGTLVGGTLTIANTSITSNSKIFVTITTLGTVAAPKAFNVTKIANTSFTVTSSDNTDTSTFDWFIIETT